MLFEKEFVQNHDLNQNIILNGAMTGVYLISIRSEGVSLTKKIIID
jgi:hypothetical protein